VTDYALVVGIGHYPQLTADGVVSDLDGPDNDAQAVYDWLVEPAGGGLSRDDVTLIRSAEFRAGADPDDPQPATHRIEAALRRIEQATRKDSGGRLYLYFSGHGFSPELEEGALFTAEASLMSPSYVYAHSWLRWFRKARRFREAVLWMDCCMNYQQSIPVSEVLLRTTLGTGVPGPVFIGLAAQTRSALETRMPDGQVHGVFTWTLLRGLRGGAADERGRVTGDSLKTFLYAAMPEFLPAEARASTSADLQPFVRADDGMVFQRLDSRPKYPVRLTLPADAAGRQLRIWTGRPLHRTVTEDLAGTEWKGELLRGLYVAEVPGAGLRHGFPVTGSGPVEVQLSDTGSPVVVPDESTLVRLDVVAGNPAGTIVVSDHRFERIFAETGELHERDLPGVYKIREEYGRDITLSSDTVVLLDRDLRIGAPPAPAMLPDREFGGGLESIGERGGRTAAALGTGFSLIGRGADPGPTGAPRHPLAGVTLTDASGAAVGNPAADSGVRIDSGQPVATWERELAPGPYFLSQTLPNGRSFEACVQVVPNWVSTVSVQRTGAAGGAGNFGVVSLSMRPAGSGMPAAEQESAVDAARLALTQGRDLFGEGRGDQLKDLLLHRYEDPIAGIIGAHLLLRSMAAGQRDPAQASLFDEAVAALRAKVGDDHPDVEALSLRCRSRARRGNRPFRFPPTFAASWQLLTAASVAKPDLVPIQLWQRVHASVAFSSFFLWATDEPTRATHARQLSDWIAGYTDVPGAPTGGALPAVVRADARRMQLPAAAADALWAQHGRSRAG
jgi:hypothetical protein